MKVKEVRKAVDELTVEDVNNLSEVDLHNPLGIDEKSYKEKYMKLEDIGFVEKFKAFGTIRFELSREGRLALRLLGYS